MRSWLIATVITGACMWSCLEATQQALAAHSAQAVDDTSFYKVPLTCPAARGLGCGTRAKPVLVDLQKRPIVEEAWLNETGEILAIVWKPGTDAPSRESAITAVTDAHAVSMTELETGARAEVLTAFRSRAGWHRGSDVDRLSEQEARVTIGSPARSTGRAKTER